MGPGPAQQDAAASGPRHRLPPHRHPQVAALQAILIPVSNSGHPRPRHQPHGGPQGRPPPQHPVLQFVACRRPYLRVSPSDRCTSASRPQPAMARPQRFTTRPGRPSPSFPHGRICRCGRFHRSTRACRPCLAGRRGRADQLGRTDRRHWARRGAPGGRCAVSAGRRAAFGGRSVQPPARRVRRSARHRGQGGATVWAAFRSRCSRHPSQCVPTKV